MTNENEKKAPENRQGSSEAMRRYMTENLLALAKRENDAELEARMLERKATEGW